MWPTGPWSHLVPSAQTTSLTLGAVSPPTTNDVGNSIGRYHDGERERVVVVPMVAYWLRGRPEFQRDDEASIMAELRAIRERCRQAGQTLEVWAPSYPLKAK